MRLDWSAKSPKAGVVRPPAVAGSFYPGSRGALAAQIQDFIDRAPLTPPKGELIGIIAPHAGYVYSGHVAGYAYKQLEGSAFDTVVLVGLSHRYPVHGAAIYAHGAFRTPLGDVDIDEELAVAMIQKNDRVIDLPDAHMAEHSLEVQLPFLQHALPHFRIVPILLQDDSPENVIPLSQTIAQVIRNRSALLVGSTDLCHYPVYEEAQKSDRVVVEAIRHFDPAYLRGQMDGYMRTHQVPGLHCMMCSTGAIYTTMEAAKQVGGSRIDVLKTASSGDVPTGRRDQVVGYMAAAIYR